MGSRHSSNSNKPKNSTQTNSFNSLEQNKWIFVKPKPSKYNKLDQLYHGYIREMNIDPDTCPTAVIHIMETYSNTGIEYRRIYTNLKQFTVPLEAIDVVVTTNNSELNDLNIACPKCKPAPLQCTKSIKYKIMINTPITNHQIIFAPYKSQKEEYDEYIVNEYKCNICDYFVIHKTKTKYKKIQNRYSHQDIKILSSDMSEWRITGRERLSTQSHYQCDECSLNMILLKNEFKHPTTTNWWYCSWCELRVFSTAENVWDP